MDRAGRRVVVTGMGLASPVGLGVESSWEALREGRGGVGAVTRFDAGSFATRIAAELKGFDLSTDLGEAATRWEHHGRSTKIALAVAAQAVRHSGLFEGGGDRPVAIRRLSWLGRGAGGFSPIRRPGPSVARWRPGRPRAIHGPGARAAGPAP